MDVFEAIEKRYSVRGYKPDAVEDEKLAKVLEAARRAPTAANRQPFRMIVVHTEGREEELARVYGRRWLTQAPLVIAFVAVPGEAWRRMDDKPYDEVDATIAMDHLVLAATALGLGTCWIAAFDPDAARDVVRAPRRRRAGRPHAARLPGQGAARTPTAARSRSSCATSAGDEPPAALRCFASSDRATKPRSASLLPGSLGNVSVQRGNAAPWSLAGCRRHSSSRERARLRAGKRGDE